MQRYLKSTFLLLCCVLPGITFNNAIANEGRWYDVELLIYKHAKAEHFLTEQWPATWTIPNTNGSIDPQNLSRADKKYFAELNKSEQGFSGILKSLEASSRYQVLAYRSWKHWGLNKEQAMNIRINAGRKYKKLHSVNYYSSQTIPQEAEIRTGALFEPVLDNEGAIIRHTIPRYSFAADDTQPGDVVYQLDGNIKIVLSRFLHIYTDLLLLEPVILTREKSSANNSNETAKTGIVQETRGHLGIPEPEMVSPATYKLSLADDRDFTTLHGFNIKDHRRMRSDELHHLDHPLVGIIVKITPSKTSQ